MSKKASATAPTREQVSPRTVLITLGPDQYRIETSRLDLDKAQSEVEEWVGEPLELTTGWTSVERDGDDLEIADAEPSRLSNGASS